MVVVASRQVDLRIMTLNVVCVVNILHCLWRYGIRNGRSKKNRKAMCQIILFFTCSSRLVLPSVLEVHTLHVSRGPYSGPNYPCTCSLIFKFHSVPALSAPAMRCGVDRTILSIDFFFSKLNKIFLGYFNPKNTNLYRT